MNIEKLREVIRKYEENYNYFNDQAHDEIFKWNAVQHFQNVWLAPKANERSFPELFADARKKCSVLIDNAYVCPSSGVVKIAEKRPDEVEYLFRKVLLAPDGGDIDIRQDNVERFLDEMDRLCRETFPASFKYKQDRHAALCYLTLLKPDDNYIYRYSEAEEFAKHMEFGLDIGSGKSFCLRNYYILCNAVADELRGQRSLLDKVEQRIQEYPAMYYPDKKLHLLTFDLMYCARAYDLYAGMDYKDKAACIREYRQEQKEKQRQQEAAEKIASIRAAIHELDVQMEPFQVISLMNVEVYAGKYGVGHVIDQKINHITVQFAACQKEYHLHQKFFQHPSFEDDQTVIAAFTEYESLADKKERLEKELEKLSKA